MLQPTVFQSQLLINHDICFLFPYHVKWRIFRIFILLSLNLINDANKVRNKEKLYNINLQLYNLKQSSNTISLLESWYHISNEQRNLIAIKLKLACGCIRARFDTWERRSASKAPWNTDCNASATAFTSFSGTAKHTECSLLAYKVHYHSRFVYITMEN